ncbi:unnamed protein product [Camellia sinensis]
MKIIDGSLCHGCKREQEAPVIDGSCNGLDKMGYCDKGSSDLHFPLPSLSFISLCYYENARMDMRKAKGEESIVAREGGREREKRQSGGFDFTVGRERERRLLAVRKRKPEDTSKIDIAVGLVNLPLTVGGGEVEGWWQWRI